MARLTDQIGTVNSGKPIINPGPQGPSWIAGLADVAGSAVSGLSRLGEQRRQQQSRDAQNEFVAGLFEISNRPPVPEPAAAPEMVDSAPVGIDAGIEGAPLPQDAQARLQDLGRAQRAVQQGRLPQAGLDVQVEAFVASMFQRYPDQRFEIAQTAQQMGFQHYLFRDLITQRQAAQAEQESQLGAMQMQYQAAAQAGLVDGRASLEDGAAIGRQVIARQQELAAAEAAAEAAREDRRLGNEERDARLREAGNQAVAAVTGQLATAFVPLMDQIGVAVAAAGTDADRQARLGEFKISALSTLEAARTRALANTAISGNPDAVRATNEFFNQQRQSIDSLFTASFETNAQAFRNLQSAMGLNAAQAMPAYHSLVQALGQPAVNAMLADPATGTIALPAEVMAGVRSEMTNFNPADPRGALQLTRMIGYLRGEVGLRDLSGEEAIAFVRSNTSSQRANQEALLGGDTSSADRWLVSAANTAEAMVEMPPTVVNTRDLLTATNLNSSPNSRAALREAAKVNPEFAQAVALGSRNGAAQAMTIARNMGGGSSGPFTFRYNEQQGRFEPVLTREAYNRWASQQPRGNTSATVGIGFTGRGVGAAIPSYDEMRQRVPREMQERIEVLNKNLDHLVETREYDPAVASMSAREVRQLFATGRMPSTALGSGGENAPSSEESFNQILENLGTAQQNLLRDVVGTRLEPQPDDLDWVVRTMIGEAAGEDDRGLREVANVIVNRRNLGTWGNTFRDVVLARNQFEPWGSRRRELENIRTDDPRYQRALRIAREAVESGDTGSFTHFYAPRAQQALGRNAPRWDDGTGTDIGNHRFFVNPGRRNDGG